MLRKTINKNEIKSSLQVLDITGNCTYDFTNNLLTIPTTDKNVRVGDIIRLTRKDGRMINYDVPVTVVSNINGLISVGYALKKVMMPIEVGKINDVMVPMQGAQDYFTLTFNNHYYRENRDNLIISSSLAKDYMFGTKVAQCIDYKHFIFNDKYLYKSKDKDGDGKFILTSSNIENYQGINLSYGTAVTLNNGIVPINGMVDDTKIIYFPWNDTYQTYIDNKTLLQCQGYDPCFFSVDNSNIVTLKTGVTLYRELNSSLSVGLGQLFTPNISIEEDIDGNYLDGRIESNLNKIVDYEKKMFEPVYLKEYTTGNTINAGNVDKITFNLYFRNRDFDDNDWYLNDKGGWNRDKYATGLTCPIPQVCIKYGDPLGKIGFTDNDIFNRNKRFAKSFIRLSFFDSPDKNKQVLQFYSTIFFDTTTMYNRFMKNKAKYTLSLDKQYIDNVETGSSDYSLSTTFSCSGNRDSQTSSEGFYLYLFDNVIEGTKPTPLYMLVEFNHAKYGKTIPMMMPTKLNTASGLLPIDYTDAVNFPKNYIATSIHTEGNRFYADMSRFYNDLFIKVYVKYDQVSGRYVWYFPRKRSDGDIVLNLFEPQINPQPQA